MGFESADGQDDRYVGFSQQQLDKLKGFAYLETFDALRSWIEDQVDPLSRSNTPILDRQTLPGNSSSKAAKVMLIHDYKGGYNSYEACQGAVTDKDMYSCEYLQSVESFVYFSHKLVTIPPPTWINTCHRNGVKCLGTFIVEPGTEDVECILEHDTLGSFWVAHQLAQIAKIHGFDGWLVNIEESFPILSWSVEKLEGFLAQLRRGMGNDCQVVWYDALTTINFVWYQNTLNSLNLIFALAAGSILTNYAWNPRVAMSAVHMAENSGLGVNNVYFGIDVWAQNLQTGRHRRVTYPVEGGGGTGTGLGLRSLKELGLNAGIFAPGWSFEHFSSNCRAVERSVWLGKDLPLDLACECNPGSPHEIVPYRLNGIVRHAARFPSGSGNFFHTDLTRALTPTTGEAYVAHIGSQSVLPLPSTALVIPEPGTKPQLGGGVVEACGSIELSSVLGRSILSFHNSQERSQCNQVTATLPLFDLCMSSEELPELTVSYRHLQKPTYMLALVIQYSGARHHRVVMPNDHQELQTTKTTLPSMSGHVTGIFIDFVCEDTGRLPRVKNDLLELISITIQPSGGTKSCKLTGLRLEQRNEAETKHYRLAWDVEGWTAEQARDQSMGPFSHTTGPCAYFTVEMGGVEAGIACALEFVVPAHVEEKCRLHGTIETKITAVGFDGSALAHTVETLSWPTGDDDWIFVSHEDGLRQ